MNYRTLAKGALALSLSLIVGSAMATTTVADVQKYGATFESTVNTTVGELNDYAYEEGTNVTKYAVTTGNPSGWFGAAEDESKIIARTDTAGGQALQLNTDAATLTNKLESTIASDVNAGIAAAGAYIETEAKFVASDTLDAGVVGGTDDTKFAIYAYADENASPCTTNLVVYHAYEYTDQNEDVITAFTNEVFNSVTINTEVFTKVRVVMKKYDNGDSQFINVFSVSINDGEPLSSPLAKSDGIWFQTVEDIEDTPNTRLATINFKGTGEVDNLAVGIIQETTTYAIDWSASQNVIASNLTDTVQLAAGETNFANNVQLAFYPTEGNLITNVNGVTQSPALDVYTYTVNAADTNLVILAGVQAAPATVITVATVGNANVTDNQDGTYTISVPLGNGLSSVFVNGAAVDPSLLTDNNDGTYTLDLTTAGLTGNVNIVVATKKVRTPIGHKWWENPGVIAVNTLDAAWTVGYGPWHLDMDGDFVAATGWMRSNTTPADKTGVVIYDVDSLANESATPLMKRNHDDSDGAGNWSAAVSMPLNVALTGPASGAKAIAYALNSSAPVIGEDAFIIENDLGIGLYDMEFTPDGQYLYAACYNENGVSNARNYIYKFRVLNGLKSSGINLVCEAQFNLGERVRGFTVGHFSGGDVIYALLYTSKSVIAFDTSAANATPITLIANAGANTGDVAVSGIAAGTPRLTLAIGGTADKLQVYSLAANGLSFASPDPLLSLDGTAALGTIGVPAGAYGATPCITEDEETLILGCGNMKIAYIQYVEPPTPTVISIACVGGATYTDANGTLTFAAPAGYTISSIFTNGVDTGSTTTFTTNGLTGTVKIIAAATKTRTAPEHKWYESPGKVYSYTTSVTADGDGIPGCNWGIDVGNDYVVDTKDWATGGTELMDFNAIEANAGTTDPINPLWAINYNDITGTPSLRGGAVSKEHNVALFGTYSSAYLFAAPLSADADANGILTNYTKVVLKNLAGDTAFGANSMAFSADGAFLYATGNSSATRNTLYKFALAGVDFTADSELQAVAEYSVGSRVRNIAYGVVNNTEVVFTAGDAKVVKIVDLSTGTVTNSVALRTEYDQLVVAGSSLYIGLSVSGIADADRPAAELLQRYSIANDLSLTFEQSWTQETLFGIAGITHGSAGAHEIAFVVSDDEKSLLVAFHKNSSTRYLIQYVLPTYLVDWTGSTNVDVTVDGDAWDGGTAGNFTNNTVVVFTADSGMMITNVAGEAYGPASTFTLTVTEATNIVVKAGVQTSAAEFQENDVYGDVTLTAAQATWLNSFNNYDTIDAALKADSSNLEKRYLLNVDPLTGDGSITITGITIDAQGVHVAVALSRTESGSAISGNRAINGTLCLYGTADLTAGMSRGPLESVTLDNGTFASGNTATATFTGSGETFFKAVIE